MNKLYAENILIGSQWQSNKTLSISKSGEILAIEEGKTPSATILDGPVIPGMVNCHSHAFQRAFAGYSEYRGRSKSGAYVEDSFWSWRDIMYQFVGKMSPQDAHTVARFVYMEMLQAGYTSVAEFHYLHHQASGQQYDDPAEMSHQIINAASQTGISLTHLPVLYSYAGFGDMKPSQAQGRFIHSTDEYLKLIEALSDQYSDSANFKLGIAPHSLRAVNQQQLNEVTQHIRKIDKHSPIHIHIAEQMQEVNDCLQHHGQRPVEWLLDNFLMDCNWCLIHATHLTGSERCNLAKSSAVTGICPTTEANLGDGIFPAAEFLRQGGQVAIGSDSHISINVAEEIRLLEYAQRLTKHQRAVLVGEQCASVGQFLYSETCINGASAISQNVGKIAVGKRADLLVLDEQNPSLFSKKEHAILDAAIFSCAQLPVKDVFVAGRQVLHSGRHDHQSEIIENYRAVLTKLTR